jgi:hypothetical protein
MVWDYIEWNGVGFLSGWKGRWMLNSMWPFWSRGCCKSWRILEFQKVTLSFNQIMTPSTPLGEPKSDLKNRRSSFCTGLHNLQTLIPLNILGVISRDASQGIRVLLQEFINCGNE